LRKYGSDIFGIASYLSSMREALHWLYSQLGERIMNKLMSPVALGPDRESFFGGTAAGYTDYPFYQGEALAA